MNDERPKEMNDNSLRGASIQKTNLPNYFSHINAELYQFCSSLTDPNLLFLRSPDAVYTSSWMFLLK